MPSLEATLRHQEILKTLHQEGRVEVGALARRFGVSAVTVRADLEYLERQGLLRRTRGGAVPAEAKRFELPLEETRQVHAREKESIGRYAAGLVRDGETLILDVGSTTTELARALPMHLKNVVVITSALNIALLLEAHPGLTVIVTGGTLRPLQHSLVNPYGTLLLREINADKAFIGCNGVHPEKGFTNTNLQEAEIKRAMMEAARETVVLADHSKLMQVAAARIAPLRAARLLITDHKAKAEDLARLREGGLEVVMAPRG
ncbi:MAG: DeoR/GlpR family DNA-binding transcription regulator [Meiothermus sp.]|uniref:DeoR/GlpR family DNA-binding transcription regulator n=1 Tax=Meiothermus sp. TaxID=1955249 RepID=UPI00298EDD6E|nr:DeoR/GlpR family DNA-binding transcription regulator [Meiothermus sp.]MCX7740850.1 DeoR/GlpR family DNA-binding transcription regulator [Meiothermus sp.]MDW8481825.1 DeoR/GlpR family DNA-binding transcription regulator [Meiothermus sp.]